MDVKQWKSNSFYFRLYFDTFSTNAKGTMAYVLMVDVDRPSIKIGLEFLQKNGKDTYDNSNKLAYLFFPLFRKTIQTMTALLS